MDLERLSLNQVTVEPLSLDEVIRQCGDANISKVGVWRHKVTAKGVRRSAAALRAAGLGVSSLCRAGMFTYCDATERLARYTDNLRSLEEAATLGAEVLVLVCGPPRGSDLSLSRRQIRDGAAELADRAAAMGVLLGLEPLHPMMIGERSAVVTLGEAVDIVEEIASDALGVIVDAYHVWWDPNLAEALERLRGKIVGFHVSDWLVPTTSLLRGRGLMGDGIIPLHVIAQEVTRNGYSGAVEVEIMNEAVWQRNVSELLTDIKGRFVEHV